MNIKFHKEKIFEVTIIIIDAILVLLSAIISKKLLLIYINYDNINMFIRLSTFTYIVSTIFMLYTFEFYTKTIRSRYENLLSVAISVLMSTFINIIISFIFIDMFKASSLIFFLIMPVFLFLFIGTFKILLLYLEKKIGGIPKLLVIESKDVENDLARKIKYSYLTLYESWYLLIDVNNQEEIDTIVNDTFKEYESIFISSSIPIKLRDLFISRAISQHKEVYILPDLYNISVIKSETVQFDDTPAFRIRKFGLSKMQYSIKRALDIFVSIVGIIITIPVTIPISIMIKMDSKGPIIYKQERVTKDQRIFNVYKFRTMQNDAEKTTGAVFAQENDPRVTKVGRMLRCARLDEIPQFFNVLMGDMSIVGPRPERPIFVEEYLKEIEDYDKRFFVKAGLTGLAQVYARYDTTVKDKILYDLIYINDYSFFQDIKIILLTLKIIFVKESAAGVHKKENYEMIDRE